jgi:hypothetical protein
VTKASPDDVPIRPGETYVFSLADRLQNWERFRKGENKHDAVKLVLKFQILSFGDGTGFWGNNGMAVPHAPGEGSSLDFVTWRPIGHGLNLSQVMASL